MPDQSTELLDKSMQSVLQSAPDLQSSPSTAVTVAQQPGDPAANAQTVSRVQHHAATKASLADQVSGNVGPMRDVNEGIVHGVGWLFGKIVGAAKTAVHYGDVAYHAPFHALGLEQAHEGMERAGQPALTKIAEPLNAPIQEVQHQYRYLHDVGERYGWLAATSQGVTDAAGAVVGGLVGGPSGAVMGAELAGGLQSRILYPDSWERTADGYQYRDPQTGRLVSLGRDVASLMGLRAGTGHFAEVSGVLDAAADLGLDPVAQAGRIMGAARGVEGAPGLLGKTYRGYAANTQTLDYAWEHPELYQDYHRLLSEGVAANKRGEAARWAVIEPRLGPLVPDKQITVNGKTWVAKGLGKARTEQEANDILRTFIKSKEYLSGRLPTLTSLRWRTSNLRSTAANMDTDFVDRIGGSMLSNKEKLVPTGRLGQAVGLLSPRKWADRFEHVPGMQFDADTLKLDGSTIDPTKADVPTNLMALMRGAHTQDFAVHVGTDWVNAAGSTARRAIYRNALVDTIFSMMGVRLPAGAHATAADISMLDPESQKWMGVYIDSLTSHFTPDADGLYGHTIEGAATPNVWDPATGRSYGAAVRVAQRGLMRMPKISELRQMAHAIAGARDLFGTLDEAAYRGITQEFFKPLVLQSLSYPEHIAASEAIPNMLRQGPRNYLASVLHETYTRLGTKIEAREQYQSINPLDPVARYAEKNGEAALKKLQGRFPRRADLLTHLENAGYARLSGRDYLASRFQSWLYMMEGKVPMARWDLERAAEIYEDADKGVPEVVLSGHNFGPLENASEKVSLGVRHQAERLATQKEGRRYQWIEPTQRRYVRNWKIQLRGVLNDPLQKPALYAYARARTRGLSEREATRLAEEAHVEAQGQLAPDVRDDMQRNGFAALGHSDLDPSRSWASVAVEDAKALTHSPRDRKMLPFVQDMLEKGETPPEPVLRNVLPEDRPLKLAGREMVPYGNSRLFRLANAGFKIINPIVDEISRHPAYLTEYKKQYRVLEPMIGSGMTYDEAITVAKARAAAETMRFIHSLHDRSQLSETMRNWAPFWFAQEQAYRRLGRLLAENPGAFRQYQLAITNVHDVAVRQKDNQGNDYFVVPGAGWLDRKFASVFGKWLPIGNVDPVELGGSYTALNVVFPLSQGNTPAEALRPGWGPVAVVPAKLMYGIASNIGKGYSGWAPLAQKAAMADNYVMGDSAITESMWKEFVPNTAIQRTVEAGAGYFGIRDRAFASAMMMTSQTLMFEQDRALRRWYDGGEKGAPPQILPMHQVNVNGQMIWTLDDSTRGQQIVLDRLKNMTFLNLMGRMMIGTSSPVSAEVQVQNFGLSKELQDAINAAGSVSVGMQNFLRANPDATPYTVAQSVHPETGSSLPSSLEGENWINANRPFIEKYPTASMWFMPQLKDNKYNASVYNEQLAAGQRVKRTPEQYLTQLYVAAGDQTYFYNLTFHEANIKALAGNRAGLNQEYANWDAFVTYLQQIQPTWAANSTLFSNERQTLSQQTISQLRSIFQSGDYPKNPQAEGLYELVQAYDQAAHDYTQATYSSNYASEERRVRQEWTTYLKQMKDARPELAPVISSVFSGVFYART